jgi:hypothetical protein
MISEIRNQIIHGDESVILPDAEVKMHFKLSSELGYNLPKCWFSFGFSENFLLVVPSPVFRSNCYIGKNGHRSIHPFSSSITG